MDNAYRIISTIALIGVALYAIWRVCHFIARYRFVRWKHLGKNLEETARDLKAMYPNPPLIIGIGRGGAIVASVLSTYLPGSLVFTVKRNRSHSTEPPENNFSIDSVVKFAELKRDTNILLVTDSIQLGANLEKWKNVLYQKGFTQIVTFSYAIRPGASYIPDYFVVKTGSKVYFPWKDLIPQKRRGSK